MSEAASVGSDHRQLSEEELKFENLKFRWSFNIFRPTSQSHWESGRRAALTSISIIDRFSWPSKQSIPRTFNSSSFQALNMGHDRSKFKAAGGGRSIKRASHVQSQRLSARLTCWKWTRELIFIDRKWFELRSTRNARWFSAAGNCCSQLASSSRLPARFSWCRCMSGFIICCDSFSSLLWSRWTSFNCVFPWKNLSCSSSMRLKLKSNCSRALSGWRVSSCSWATTLWLTLRRCEEWDQIRLGLLNMQLRLTN